MPEAGRLSEGGASWPSGAVRIDVVRPMSDGKDAGLVSAVAAALDPAFSTRCMLKYAGVNRRGRRLTKSRSHAG